MDRSIRPATEADARYLSHLQKVFSNQLGFLPKPALDVYAAKGWAMIGSENGTEAGYILGRPQYRYEKRMAPITQAAVAMDAQRKSLGLSLVNAWCEKARQDGKDVVQCSCANDIDAMKFWPEAGFFPICELDPKNARGRKMTVWRIPLRGFRPSWFGTPPIAAGFRAKRSTQSQLFLFDPPSALRFR